MMRDFPEYSDGTCTATNMFGEANNVLANTPRSAAQHRRPALPRSRSQIQFHLPATIKSSVSSPAIDTEKRCLPATYEAS